jgi:mannose-6-phosphate isomerase-like protein (cupin superfamily)
MDTATLVHQHYGPPVVRVETRPLPDTPTAIAPDGSEVRVLLTLPRGGMAHFRLLPGQVSRGVTHCTVEEIWYVTAGTGEMWRMKDGVEDTVALEPGTCLTVPLGTRFQFRATSDDRPLDIVGVTMPPWPGAGEAYRIEAPWTPNVPPSSDPLADSPPARAATPIITKLLGDHVAVDSLFCGRLIEILRDIPSAPNIAVLVDARPTTAHYHTRFDEIYFVLDGRLDLRLYDPLSEEIVEHALGEHELCVIPRGVHHMICRASPRNRLCAVSVPGFDRGDVHASEILGLS